MSQKFKKRIFEILEIATSGDQPSRIFDIFIVTLISLNIIAVILETVKSLSSRYMLFFRNFEIFSTGIFTIEYISRIWSCTVNARFKNPILGRIRFALTPLLIVDLLSILPFYLPMIIPLDLRFLRALRLARILRMFKMGRYSESLRMFGRVLKVKKEELLLAVFMTLILLIISSSLMYFVENEAQPQVFSSIPNAMWWGVATLTTVGYGDVYPVTPIGKFLGAIIAILGIGMFALPAGILASGFVEEIQKRRTKRIICPHCGKNINEPPETSSNKENKDFPKLPSATSFIRKT
jgi:voltage-gated potassium channel